MKEVKGAAANEARGTPVEAYAAQVMGDEARTAALFRALPNHVPPERFERNLINLLMQKPDMLKYDARLVYREVSTAAALGLLLDPQLGEAFVVPVWNGATKREEPQLRVGYRGIIKLARQSGEVSNVYAHEVHEQDYIDCDLGVDKRLVHKPNLFGERGKVIGYYAVVKYKDGTHDFEPMSMQQIHLIRERSDAWLAFKAGKIASTPWASDEDEMGKKTVIKRLLKRVAQSPDLVSALRIDDDVVSEETNVIRMREVPRRTKPQSIAARLDSFAGAQGGYDTAAVPDEAVPFSPRVLADNVEPRAAPGHADAPMAKKLLAAMERGRAARREGLARTVPKTLSGKKRAAEAEAFLAGWDEETFEIRAEAFGCV